MDFLSLVFRLGVILAIFSFIWALIQFGIAVLQAGRQVPYAVSLGLKIVQYFLLADVVVMFCYSSQQTLNESLIFSGLILLIYFLGKINAAQNRFMMVQVQGPFATAKPQKLNLRLEMIPLVAGIASFVFFALKPEFAENPAAAWFYSNIAGIEKAPVFGFIFKIVGFFFSITILLRLINAFMLILTGGRVFHRKDEGDEEDRNNKGFDNYEEVD